MRRRWRDWRRGGVAAGLALGLVVGLPGCATPPEPLQVGLVKFSSNSPTGEVGPHPLADGMVLTLGGDSVHLEKDQTSDSWHATATLNLAGPPGVSYSQAQCQVGYATDLPEGGKAVFTVSVAGHCYTFNIVQGGCDTQKHSHAMRAFVLNGPFVSGGTLPVDLRLTVTRPKKGEHATASMQSFDMHLVPDRPVAPAHSCYLWW